MAIALMPDKHEFTFGFKWYDPIDVNAGGTPHYDDPNMNSDGDGISNSGLTRHSSVLPFPTVSQSAVGCRRIYRR